MNNRPPTTTSAPEDTPGSGPELPPAPPPAAAFATRAELLRARAAALPPLQHADTSLRTVLVTGLLTVMASALLALTTIGWLPEVDPNRDPTSNGEAIFFAALFGLPGAALAWPAIRRTLRSREIGRRRRAWENLPDDPAAIDLPPGDLTHDLRDFFDAQTPADGWRVLSAGDERYGHVWSDSLLYRAGIFGLFLSIGATVLGIGLLGTFGDEGMGMFGFVVGGTLLFGAACIQARKTVQRGFRAQHQRDRFRKDLHAWRDATGIYSDLREA